MYKFIAYYVNTELEIITDSGKSAYKIAKANVSIVTGSLMFVEEIYLN